MKEQIEFETNGLTVLAIKTPLWYVRSQVYMGYLIMTVHNEAAIIGEDEMFPPEKLEKAMQRAEKHPEFKDVPFKLPEGDWKVHAVTPLTEEQAKALVPSVPFYPDYFNGETTDTLYPNYEDDECYSICTALESFNSLLRSHGIDPAEKWVILIKQNETK